MTEEGEKNVPAWDAAVIPGNSRANFPLHDQLVCERISTKVVSTGGPVICERAMYNRARTWAHDSVGVTSPSDTWYLAEGCTKGDFQTWICVQNPNPGPVTVDLTFMTEEGEKNVPAWDAAVIPGNSRANFPLHDQLTCERISTKVRVTSGGPVICERAMYNRARTWAHDSVGVTSPSDTWYLAEGCTQGDFQTWICVQNPNPGPVTVDLTFMTEEGEKNVPAWDAAVIPGNSRANFPLHDQLTCERISTKVRVTSGGPVICERAMYNRARTWAHDSIGVTSPSD
ncbi:MAG: hypothetical protein H5T44_06410, partial [Thermoplasmatales archaeon]|nr:hypothetical protein [Thermoplasmatales archaeon]